MNEQNINGFLEVFKMGIELNLGVFPDIKIVKYGYSCIDGKLTLYLEGSGDEVNILKNYKETTDVAHFYKFSSKGKMVKGNGKITLLESKEDKIYGLNYIKKQSGKDNEYNFNEKELNNIHILKVAVENFYVI